jgi:hypothetical protein
VEVVEEVEDGLMEREEPQGRLLQLQEEQR